VLIDPLRHIHLDVIDSTNAYIKNSGVAAGTWVTASEQTAGRGQGTNSWIAFGEERLIFSAKIALASSYDISSLSINVGEALLKTCQHFGERPSEFAIKLPNDILRAGKKIAGILIEIEKSQDYSVIVGIGVNISGQNVPDELPNATYLSDNAGPTPLALAHELIAQLNNVLQ